MTASRDDFSLTVTYLFAPISVERLLILVVAHLGGTCTVRNTGRITNARPANPKAQEALRAPILFSGTPPL